MKRSILMILPFAVAVLLIAGCQPAAEGNNTTDNETVACTLDAKICPDGSAVGRVPPTCEFAACPGENGGPQEVIVHDRQVKGESAAQCETIRFTCEDGYEYYADNESCGCVMYGTDVEFKGEDIACTREYNPVCAWYNQSVQCLAYPCAVTVGNTCMAQTVENVDYYTPGACPLPSEGVPGKVGENTLIAYTYQPMQCDSTPWEAWLAVAQFEAGNVPEGEELIIAYYQSKGVQVEDVQRVEGDMVVCQACNVCPTTHSYTMNARAGDKLTLSEDGWESNELSVGGERTECTDPRPESCYEIYQPVCGDNSMTYANDCMACLDEDVNSHTPGECSDAQGRKYASRDPDQCAAMTFICEEGMQHFFDETGCGCEPAQ